MEEDRLPALVFLFGTLIGILLLVRAVISLLYKRARKIKRSVEDARRHFNKAASLMQEAKKAPPGHAKFLAGIALEEANNALELANDAAFHIVKSLALEQLGDTAAAVKVLDTALSPQLQKDLSKIERSDLLTKRAELLLDQGGVLEALFDLQESVQLGATNPRTYLMLGTCYEQTGKVEKALEAFKRALDFDPSSADAKLGVQRNTERLMVPS